MFQWEAVHRGIICGPWCPFRVLRQPMEILFELLMGLLELLLEIVLQVGFEWMVDKLLSGLGLNSRWKPRPQGTFPAWLDVVGAIAIGSLCGGVSLMVLPHAVIGSVALRVVALVFTPVVAGLLMGALGRRRVQNGLLIGPLHRFLCGYTFALALALVRFFLAG